MKLKINEELKSLIPPLKPDEYDLFSKGCLGFKSGDSLLILTPSTIGPRWFHAQYFDPSGLVEHYTKRPMALSRIAFLEPYCAAFEKVRLYPEKMEPRDFDFNIRESSKEKLAKETNVYIIQSEIGGPVKIGRTKNIEQRVNSHQSSCPFILNVVKTFMDVPVEFERELHEKYDKYRLHGEWFDDTILSLIKRDYE